MQPQSTFYARYATPLLQHPQPPPPTLAPPYHPAPAAAPQPSPYVYSQYAAPYPSPVAYTSYVAPPTLLHAAPPPPTPTTATAYTPPPPAPQTPYSTAASEREAFYSKLHAFRDALGEPIQRLPTLGFKELDLCVLYKEVIKRNGIDAVIAKKQWKEVAEALQLPSSCTDSGFRLRLHYKKYLEAFERKFYKPPLDLEMRERKKKTGTSASAGGRPCSGSESAETDPGVGDGEDESADSGSGPSNGRAKSEATSREGSAVGGGKRSPIVKRKKRVQSVTRKEVKKVLGSDGKEEGEDQGRSRVHAIHVKHADEGPKAKDAGTIERKQRARMEKCGPSLMASAPARGSVRSKEEANSDGIVDDAGGSETGESMKVGDAEREAAATLMEAKRERKLSVGRSREVGRVRTFGAKAVISKGSEQKRNKVDFSVLESATLKRYVRVHGVSVGAGKDGGKMGLAECVSRHFSNTPLCGGETAALLRFIQAVRRR